MSARQLNLAFLVALNWGSCVFLYRYTLYVSSVHIVDRMCLHGSMISPNMRESQLEKRQLMAQCHGGLVAVA